ncbi:arylesterase [Marinobacter bryozoorum]|uniref:arylesterase n=1 Tax=Marinobacter bryozoorum TaxID=256324 RepID=UPI00200591B6|nr:arylesterase [Marinobacter bryozoorum]MCK7544589.1 arylesterase [Marinobacter bryozoorum]
MPGAAAASTILVMGDSLSAAYGVETETAWVNLLRERLSEEDHDQWQVVNASISGETTDGGARRLPALLDRHQPDIVIIELGGNDGLRGFQPPVIRDNLSAMIEASREGGASVLLVGMQIPPNYGPRYTRMFADMFPDLSDQYNTGLVPFFLEGIYNGDGMMQDDGIHPTGEAQPLLLDNVWPHLVPLLQETTAASR